MAIVETICAYGCGRPWRRGVGRPTDREEPRLRGHLACQLSPEGRAALLAVLERFPVTIRRLAFDFGVPEKWMRFWLSQAKADRARRMRRRA